MSLLSGGFMNGFCENDLFARDGHVAGRPTTTRTPVLEEAVLHEIE